jgi:hypothetical protein
MATANKRTRNEVRTKMVEARYVQQIPDGVTLTLSHAEANTLAWLCYRTGGDPDKSARGYADSIAKALRSAGYRPFPSDYPRMTTDSGIHFKEESRAIVEAEEIQE